MNAAEWREASREHARRIGHLNRTHGMTRSPTYRSWESMKRRCTKETDPKYVDYGGRGIKVCERWLNSFESFLADLGERPERTTLDRFPNNDGDYEPGNCRWATIRQQSMNKRSNIIVDFGGERVPLKVVSERTGIPYKRLHRRIRQLGWSLADAISKPDGRSK